MSRRKQSNPKPLKRPFSELLVELAKSLNLPEDLSLKPRRPVCCNSLLQQSHEIGLKDDRIVNGVDESNDELKPKQTNKSRSKDHINFTVDEVVFSSKENSIDDLVKIEQQDTTIGRRPCNGESKNDNECSQSATRLDKNGIDNSTDDLNNNTKCNQNCCALFSIYSERKLIKGHRFGPYLARKLICTDDLNKQTSTDHLNDKENRFSKIDFYQVQEPAGFWLKFVRTSSKPTASLQIKENELWIEILEDMNEESELCVETKYRYETISKGLNRLSTTTMITDEMLDKIIEEETNGRTDKREATDDGLNLNEESSDKETLENAIKQSLKDASDDELMKSSESKPEFNSTNVSYTDNDDSLNLTDPLNFVCKLCEIRFSSKNTLTAHHNSHCTKRHSDQSNSIGETLRMLASGLSNRQSEKRSLNGNSNELNVKKYQIEEMCNNTGRDQVTVSGNSQMSNDVSSDLDELEKMADEQINNSNNSSVSLNNLKSVHQQTQSNDSNGLTDSTNTARFLQTINQLLGSSLCAVVQDEQTAANNEILETIHRLIGQSGNQNLANSLLAAAANQQRTNWFACKFCTYTTGKRQQLIKHVRTNCEGLLNAVANLNSNLQSVVSTPGTHTVTTINTSSTNTNSTNTVTTNCSSPSQSGEQMHNNDDSSNAAQLLNSTNLMAAAALSTDQLNSGCGNLACVNSNCSNGNACVLLPNAGALLNADKFKVTPADDSEDDLMNSANPQDRYCMECEIQFASYKNYKVHKQIYCGSRHCSQKQQPSPVNTIPRKRTISDTISNPSSIAAATLTTSAVNNITSLLGSVSPPKAQSSNNNLFANQSSLSNLCKNSSLLSANANSTNESDSPGLQQTVGANNMQASMAGLNSTSNPLSSTSSNAHQAALLNELFANGNIINLNNSLNIIQQLSQPVYIAISTNPLILLPINSALANVSSTTTTSNSLTTNSSTTTTTSTASNNNKLLSTSSSQDVAEQLLNHPLNGLLNQAVLDSLNKASTTVQRTGDEPMDLSSKRQKTSRFSGVASNFEQNETFANNPQLLNSISIDTLKALTNPANQVDLANAFLLPKSLSSLSAQQQLQLVLSQPRIYTCGNCQIDFHKQENYAVHKRHYCSATKQLLLEQQQAQKLSPTPIDDNESGNLPSISAPNSPQSNQSQQANNRASAASNSSNSTPTVSLVDTFNQVNQITKKTSTSSAIMLNSGCVSPSMSNSPIGSPPSFVPSNQLTNSTANSSTISPAQPTYKHYCNKCGIRFTSKDNLQAHQTYYCTNNINGLTSTITTFNAVSGAIELNCPKCRSSYCSEEAFLAHICPANVSSQVSTVNSTSISTQTNTSTSVNTNATNNLIEALESLKQHTLTKFTSSIFNSAVSNSLIQTNNNLTTTATKSNNNNQAFKCTICGYKGHTIRGMKTHVRVHGDQLQGNQEENFIISLTDECCSGVPLNGVNCQNPNCRNTRSNLTTNKRRRSADQIVMLSNFLPTNTSNISKEILLGGNNLSPLLSSSLMNGFMGNLMNNLANVNHLVSGLGASLPGGLANNTMANDGLSTTSETEDNVDNVEQSNSLNTATTCNGTAVLSSSNNSNIVEVVHRLEPEDHLK